MTHKPTYEDLVVRVQELEQQIAQLDKNSPLPCQDDVPGPNTKDTLSGDETEAMQSLTAPITVQHAHKLLQLVIETIPLRLFWKDRNLTYLGCNTLFAKDAGYTHPSDLIGKNDFSMGWTTQAEQYRQDDLEIINTGKSKLHYEEEQTSPTGERRWISTSKVPLRDDKNNIVGILGTYVDITRKKLVDEELIKVQKLKSLERQAGGMAHNFNNILMSIMGNISFALMDTPTDGNVFQRLKIAEQACLQAKELCQQFLKFSKGGTPVREPLDIGQLIHANCQLVMSGTKTSYECSFPDTLWSVLADSGQIGQVITNILINADQAMPEGGVIRIHAVNDVNNNQSELPLEPGKYVKVTIKDEGGGINSADIHKIFDPYYSTKPTGNGLGLSSAYSIINKHKGYILLESTSPSGSQFAIYLPAAS